jgi:hypothetical protein
LEGIATEVISMKNFEHARSFAESQFKKQERQFSVSQKAAAECEAAVNANTAQLRALRLARNAAQNAVLENPTEVSTAKKCSA